MSGKERKIAVISREDWVFRFKIVFTASTAVIVACLIAMVVVANASVA